MRASFATNFYIVRYLFMPRSEKKILMQCENENKKYEQKKLGFGERKCVAIVLCARNG
jgi:hypothetical protein